MKNKYNLAAACLALSLLLCGCTAIPKGPPTVVTVWTYYNGGAKTSFDSMVEEFNKTVGADKNIVVDAYTQGDVNQLADAVLAAANHDVGTEQMPHIFAAYPDNALRIDKLGLVADLDTYFTEKELSEYRHEFVDGGRFGAGNELKILPIAKSSENIFLNKTDFDKYMNGASDTASLSTWEGLAATAKQLYELTDAQTEAANDGKALFGIDSMANFMLVSARQLGCEIYTQEGGTISLNFPKEVARKIWDNFYIPFISGHYTAVGRFRSDDAAVGEVLSYAGSTASAAYFPLQIETGKDAEYPVECVVLPYPHFMDGEKITVEQGAGMVITKSDQAHEKASAEFLKWFCDKEQNLSFAVKTGYIPVKNDALKFEAFKKAFDAMPALETSAIVLASTETAYKMLDSYTFYSSKPFENSYDSRKVLDSSLLTYAKADLVAIDALLSENADRAALVTQYAGQENFEKWYTQFMAQANTAIGN